MHDGVLSFQRSRRRRRSREISLSSSVDFTANRGRDNPFAITSSTLTLQ